jgi:tRNA(Ile)-lysidine synthase
MSLLEVFRDNIEKWFDEVPDRILVAVSGGVDSVVLGDVVREWCLEKGCEMFAVTVDHGLREGSGDEALEVSGLMEEKGVRHEILKWDGEDVSSNVEALAREGRYGLLCEYALMHNVGVIVTGHHGDDELENFFIRLSRGSGIDGLALMDVKQELSERVELFRPFMEVRKQELLDYADKKNLRFFEDETNGDERFKRNKIRQLLAELEDGGLVFKRTRKTMEHFSRAKSFFREHVGEVYERIVEEEKGKLIVDLARFNELHEEIALRLLVKVFAQVGGGKYKPRFEKLLDVYEKIKNKKINKRMTFAKTIIEYKNETLIFIPEINNAGLHE